MCQKFKGTRNLFIDLFAHIKPPLENYRISAHDWAFTPSVISSIFKNWKWHKQMMPIHISTSPSLSQKRGTHTHTQIFIVIDRFFLLLNIYFHISLFSWEENFLSIFSHTITLLSNLIVVSTFIMMSRRIFSSSFSFYFFFLVHVRINEWEKSFHSIIWKLMIARLKSFVITYRFATTEPIHKFSSERKRLGFLEVFPW